MMCDNRLIRFILFSSNICKYDTYIWQISLSHCYARPSHSVERRSELIILALFHLVSHRLVNMKWEPRSIANYRHNSNSSRDRYPWRTIMNTILTNDRMCVPYFDKWNVVSQLYSFIEFDVSWMNHECYLACFLCSPALSFRSNPSRLSHVQRGELVERIQTLDILCLANYGSRCSLRIQIKPLRCHDWTMMVVYNCSNW
jgi:hypothetical protein